MINRKCKRCKWHNINLWLSIGLMFHCEGLVPIIYYSHSWFWVLHIPGWVFFFPISCSWFALCSNWSSVSDHSVRKPVWKSSVSMIRKKSVESSDFVLLNFLNRTKTKVKSGKFSYSQLWTCMVHLARSPPERCDTIRRSDFKMKLCFFLMIQVAEECKLNSNSSSICCVVVSGLL